MIIDSKSHTNGLLYTSALSYTVRHVIFKKFQRAAVGMSYSKDSKEQPPPYDQVTTIDIDSGTAPLLSETFSGSIFGTATIIKFELALGSYPKHDPHHTAYASCSCVDKACDYTFVVRDFLECPQANGSVANTAEDLHTILSDVRGNKILEFRRRVFDNIEPQATPPSALTNFLEIIFNKKETKVTNHTFEVSKNGQIIGMVTYADNGPPDTCLRVYIGSGASELVVKSSSKGEFIIFRDQSSTGPLCNINTEYYKFSGKIIFHPETGITTDEQLLCTAAAFAYKTCCTKQEIISSNYFFLYIGFWMAFTFCAIVIVTLLIFTNI